jgi:hypothetical protein
VDAKVANFFDEPRFMLRRGLVPAPSDHAAYPFFRTYIGSIADCATIQLRLSVSAGMQRYYKGHHISIAPERDPENQLFRALVTIVTVAGGDSFVYRHPFEGTFYDDNDAELHGIKWAMDWIDQNALIT